MTTTRGELQAEIYSILGRDSTSSGFLAPDKVNARIQDALDYISTKMLKTGGGWLTRVTYADTVANSPYVDLPAGLAIVNFVKIKDDSGNYQPIQFNENAKGVTTSSIVATGTAFKPVWRFSSGKIYLEPTPSTAVEDAIMIDGYFYPGVLTSNSSQISGDLDNRCFVQYAKWRAADTLYRLATGKATSPFLADVAEWKQACTEMISRRSREPTPMVPFTDY